MAYKGITLRERTRKNYQKARPTYSKEPFKSYGQRQKKRMKEVIVC